MSIEQFHETADHLINTVHSFVAANIDGGWKSPLEEAENALNRLSATFDGLSGRDLVDPDANHERVFLELDKETAEALIEAVNIATESPRLSDAVVERAQEATTRITDALVG
jgi:hypothetical protein